MELTTKSGRVLRMARITSASGVSMNAAFYRVNMRVPSLVSVSGTMRRSIRTKPLSWYPPSFDSGGDFSSFQAVKQEATEEVKHPFQDHHREQQR